MYAHPPPGPPRMHISLGFTIQIALKMLAPNPTFDHNPQAPLMSNSNMIYTLQTCYSLATQVRTVACCFQTILISG